MGDGYPREADCWQRGPRIALLRLALQPWQRLQALRADATVGHLAVARQAQAELDALVPTLEAALFTAAGPKRPAAGPVEAARRLACVALRRAVHNGRELDASTLGSSDRDGDLQGQLQRYSELKATVERARAAALQACQAELPRARQHVLDASAEPLQAAALALVSRSLFRRLQRLQAAAAPHTQARDAQTHDTRHTVAKLLAYLDRAASKTSPNGLFCATAVATWGERLNVHRLATPPRVDLRLNVTEARKLTAHLGFGPQMDALVRPRVTTTLHRQSAESGEVLTFWRTASLRRPEDDEALQRLGAQPIVDLFVQLADGRRSVPELLLAVASAAAEHGMEVSVEQLEPFFRQLVDAGLLHAEIELPYGCGRPLRAFAHRVEEPAVDGAPRIAELEAIEADLDAVNATPIEAAAAVRLPAILDDLARRLDAQAATLPELARPLVRDELFRLDAALDAAPGRQTTLPCPWRDALQPTVDGYARLFASMYPSSNYRQRLASAFLEHWPADTDIPLLDLYHHFQPPPPDSRVLDFPCPSSDVDSQPYQAWQQARALLVELARQARAAGEHEVRLDDTAWHALTHPLSDPTGPSETLKWTAGVLFQPVLASSANRKQQNRLVLNALFSGTGVAFARFADLHPEVEPELRRQLRASDSAETAQVPIVAELTYNHWGRTANAGLRPRLHEWELELPGDRASDAGYAAGKVLTLADLTLRYDSTEQRFHLRRIQDGRQVLPVLSSGVSPEGLVALLVAIGRQEQQPLGLLPGFAWPEEELEQDFPDGVETWPRFVRAVSSEAGTDEIDLEIVLWRRRWRFPRATIPKPPKSRPGDDADLHLATYFAAVDTWRHHHLLPRHIYLHTATVRKPTHVDLESPLHVELLRRRLASEKGDVYVTEALPGPEGLWWGGGDERSNVEVLVQLGV